MPESSRLLKSGYDRLARVYWQLEWMAFGKQLMRARTVLLDDLQTSFENRNTGPLSRILVLGDGDGRLIAELRRRFPEAEFTAMDSSAGMLERQNAAFHSIEGSGGLETIHADARLEMLAEASFDVLVMAFFLDCFESSELHECMPRWLNYVQSNGLVYYVDFIEPPRGWKRHYARCMLRALHQFFGLATGLTHRSLVSVEPIFEAERWIQRHEKRQHVDMIVARVYSRGSVMMQPADSDTPVLLPRRSAS